MVGAGQPHFTVFLTVGVWHSLQLPLHLIRARQFAINLINPNCNVIDCFNRNGQFSSSCAIECCESH